MMMPPEDERKRHQEEMITPSPKAGEQQERQIKNQWKLTNPKEGDRAHCDGPRNLC
jgi:hypothetical protein